MTPLRVSSGARPSHGVTHRALAALSPRWVLPTAPTAVADRTYRELATEVPPRSPRLGTVGCGFSVTLETAHKIAAEIRAAGTMLWHAALQNDDGSRHLGPSYVFSLRFRGRPVATRARASTRRHA